MQSPMTKISDKLDKLIDIGKISSRFVSSPLVQNLINKLGICRKDALKLKSKMKNARTYSEIDATLDMANQMMNGHGVESIDRPDYIDGYYYYTSILYVNMGDTYSTTLMYLTDRSCFEIGNWGSYVEKWEWESETGLIGNPVKQTIDIFRSPKYSDGKGGWQVEDDENNRLTIVESELELGHNEYGAIEISHGTYIKVYRKRI